jgi:hypothetical protein
MMVDNVSQMLDLETVFDWPLFHRGRVGSIPAVLARNGFGAIADPALATRYQRELPDIIAEIEALIAALG